MTGFAVVALACGVSACSGSDDKPDPAPTKTASPTPTVPVQPKGADGVTYEIQNWDDYATDPAVLAWKQTNEAAAASTNLRKVLPQVRRGFSRSVLRDVVTAYNQARKNDLHLKPLGQVRVQAANTTGSTARLTMCLWAPTTGYYEKGGEYFGKREVFWFKQNVKLKLSGDRWVITSFTYDGTCPGGAPA